jgi:hypothetical protein
MVNPKKATLNIYEMVTAAKDALLQYASPAGNPNDSYHVSTKAFIVDESDQGVVAYQCFFEKRCVF